MRRVGIAMGVALAFRRRLTGAGSVDDRFQCDDSARRVFWVLDNGSSHQGARCEARLRERWPQITVVHTPVHASWLDQTEIYFSILQRKLLDPNDFASLAELEARLLAFGEHSNGVATPFEWRFTRLDLHRVLVGLRPPAEAQAA